MPAGDLDNYSPARNSRFYLDTSALIPTSYLALKAAGKPVPYQEEQRGQKVARFAARAAKSQARLVTTMLALEEFAAKARADFRQVVAVKKGHGSWKNFRDAAPQVAKQEDANARSAAIQMATYAITQMAALGIELDEVDIKGGSSTAAAAACHKQWTNLFQIHPIDPMDALHIVVGTALGATHFITFDHAWDSISTIRTLR